MHTLIAFFCTRDRFLRLAILFLSWLVVKLYQAQGSPVWRSFDGRTTPIRKMDDGHLMNTIRMLHAYPLDTQDLRPYV